MTSELRPAVAVWREAFETWAGEPEHDNAPEAAAAVIEADREAVRAYWYRQGKDDGWQMCKENEIDRLREELAEAYVKLSGKSVHTSDCATSNAPAMEPGPCNCDAPGDTDLVAKLRDEDSYYRLQEKHWCIDAEELERQRLAAADRIEQLEREKAVVSDLWEQQKEIALGYLADCNKAADRIEALEAALREVFEEWAGSEGFIPETAPEGYLLQLTKRMADIARAALAGDSYD